MGKAMLMVALLSSASMAQDGRLANGVCSVEERNAAAKNAVVRQYEGKDVVLDAASCVPLVTVGKPEIGGGGLRVQLAPEAAKRLEELTRSHMNQRVAVVVGDRIVSTPTVRSVIRDGKARVTPCEGERCQALLHELSR